MDADAALEPNATVELVVVDDLTKLQKNNCESELICLLSSRDDVKNVIRYSLGTRLSNDRIVAQNRDNKSWPQPMDVQLRLQYPANGIGAAITYVEISVDQSSNVGRAYVTAGGIGQRSIVIIVEAKGTFLFNYVSAIYGV